MQDALQIQQYLAKWKVEQSNSDCFIAATIALQSQSSSIPTTISCSFGTESEDIKLQEYVVQLTKCELRAAGVPIPRECQPSIWSNRKDELVRCTQAFSRVPQLWTSYSTSLKHAQVICYSLKSDADKSQIVAFYETLSEVQLANYHLFLEHSENFDTFKTEQEEIFADISRSQLDMLGRADESTMLAKTIKERMDDLLRFLENEQVVLSQELINVHDSTTIFKDSFQNNLNAALAVITKKAS
ncbi:hypothetical protein HK100_010353 [Physocladia obscura]|uniref:Uncharacterized protein n=1 Tax=Physocladia obscura TaxID=109957 RepID=A0AAD5T2F3_9FUNG|nr:hypothetical protein HK100_010353 [Physocladia obscura]